MASVAAVIVLQLFSTPMDRQFETTLKRRSHRQRFYSSMNYDQFCEIYGPPSPLFKPQEDPIEDLPLFDLQQSQQRPVEPTTSQTLQVVRMETILEIDGSQNFTQNLQFSPRVELLSLHSRGRSKEEQLQTPKRMRVRMRSQSDNSEYLIFNFLERANEKGRKRIKMDE